MGHKVNSLIFRSKSFPYYTNLWNNFFSVSNKLIILLNFKKFIKFNKKLNILNIQFNYYNNYCIFNLIFYSKNSFISNKYYITLIISKFLKKNYLKKINFCINFIILKHPLLSTNFILKYFFIKLSYTKSSLRKIIPQIVLLINSNYKIKGFKCIISGRINGVQMARLETFKFNENSSQHKISYIKYSFIKIPTKYGLLGVKLWLFLK